MKFTIQVPNISQVRATTQPWYVDVGGPEIAQAMQLADDLGYWKAMTGEHFVMPKAQVEDSGSHFVDSSTALAFVAGHTKNIKLASSVALVPLKNPIVQAKTWATLDWLSGGRAVLMAGVGWLEEEFEMIGVPFHERGRICDEYIAAMIELWTNDVATFEGKYVSFRDACADPKPVQKPHLAIWFGGDGQPVLKRLAKWGDGWSPQSRTAPERYPELLDYVRSQPDYHGRPIDISFAFSRLALGHAHVSTDNPDAVGSYDVNLIVDKVGWLAEHGVTEVRLAIPPLTDFEAYLDWIRWAAEEIFPRTADLGTTPI
ncbi:MAG: TIGR03619 family F420-dependent LLM class oxidoreductase [Ilumatobacteraceae bacterium]